MLDEHANLIDLIGQLPGDIKRVEESVLDIHCQILWDFRHEDRPVVEALDEYLAKQDELVNSALRSARRPPRLPGRFGRPTHPSVDVTRRWIALGIQDVRTERA
jgi:uncharacterized protein DUF3375